MRKSFYLTKTGVKTLRGELKRLKAERPAIAERVKAAREFGDLSENAEYTASRLEQERTESRIAEIENILQNIELIQEQQESDHVQLGVMVTLQDASGTTKQFKIVGTVEADPLRGLISDESPLGQALLTKSVSETIEVSSRTGVVTFTITKIG